MSLIKSELSQIGAFRGISGAGFCFLVLVLAGSTARSMAAGSRSELLFDVDSALHTRDPSALARCFNFEGVDNVSRQKIGRIIGQMCSWPDACLKTSERKNLGDTSFEQDGKQFVLNGDWYYQVHIYQGPGEQRGYVFPAGRSRRGDALILVATEKQPAEANHQ